jgi:hypothetical protein
MQRQGKGQVVAKCCCVVAGERVRGKVLCVTVGCGGGSWVG